MQPYSRQYSARLFLSLSILSVLFISSCSDVVVPGDECINCGPLPGHIVVSDMVFVDSLAGWIITYRDSTGSSSIFKTVNGGVSWFKQGDASPTRGPSISFLDGIHGWVTLDSGRVTHTSDGGFTWNIQDLGDSHMWTTSILFTDPEHGWASAYGLLSGTKIFHTSNGGTNWTQVYHGYVGALPSLAVIGKHLWAAGGAMLDNFDSPVVVYSHDGGLTFNLGDFQNYSGPLNGVYFTAEALGIAGGMGGVFTSSDSGMNWNPSFSWGVLDMAGTFGPVVWITGTGRSYLSTSIYKTTNSGQEWTEEWTSPTDPLIIMTRLSFPSPTSGFASGAEYDSARNFVRPVIMKYSGAGWAILGADTL